MNAWGWCLRSRHPLVDSIRCRKKRQCLIKQLLLVCCGRARCLVDPLLRMKGRMICDRFGWSEQESTEKYLEICSFGMLIMLHTVQCEWIWDYVVYVANYYLFGVNQMHACARHAQSSDKKLWLGLFFVVHMHRYWSLASDISILILVGSKMNLSR